MDTGGAIGRPLGLIYGSVNVVAAALGLHRQTIYSALSDGKLPYDASAGAIMVRWEDVAARWPDRAKRIAEHLSTIGRGSEEKERG